LDRGDATNPRIVELEVKARRNDRKRCFMMDVFVEDREAGE